MLTANLWDPTVDRWTAIAPVPSPRGSIAVAALGTKIHLVGGRDGTQRRYAEVYDASTDVYTRAAPLSIGRRQMDLAAFNGRLYALDGRIDDPRPHHLVRRNPVEAASFDDSRLPQLGYEAKGEPPGFVKRLQVYGENY